MKYVMLAALVLAGVLPAVAEEAKKDAPPALMFLSYDVNSDGVVEIEEYVAGRTADFNKLDENKDGKLTADELKKHPKLYPVPTADEEITEEEWMAAFVPADKKPTEEQIKAAVKKMAAKKKDTSAKKMDADKDGKITPEEMGAFFIALHRTNKPANAADVDKMVVESWFVQMDKNGDGVVAIEEYTGQPLKKAAAKKTPNTKEAEKATENDVK